MVTLLWAWILCGEWPEVPSLRLRLTPADSSQKIWTSTHFLCPGQWLQWSNTRTTTWQLTGRRTWCFHSNWADLCIRYGTDRERDHTLSSDKEVRTSSGNSFPVLVWAESTRVVRNLAGGLLLASWWMGLLIALDIRFRLRSTNIFLAYFTVRVHQFFVVTQLLGTGEL